MQSPYSGPISVSELVVGGRPLRIARPSDPDRLLDDPDVLELNRRDDYMPYWAYLWPGAYLLAEAVAAEFPGRETAVEALEIGCGLGLAGLAALACGVRRVHFTDYDLTPLRFVARSAEENGFAPERFAARRLDWRDPPDERYPLILGADVLYERQLVPLVADLLDRMLATGGLALLGGPYRVATEGLDAALRDRALCVESRAISAVDEQGRALRGTIHRVSRPGDGPPAAPGS
jgi:predicted nicotinamide N-methyase